MRALVQRVKEASVEVAGDVTGRCGAGLLVLLAVAPDDTETEAAWLAHKIAHLRIFPDEQNYMNRSLVDISGSALVVSQFTLYGDCRKGRRPSFVDAAPPDHAEAVFQRTVEIFRETGLTVETGRFQAYMMVSIRNDGPFTIMLDTDDRRRPRREHSG